MRKILIGIIVFTLGCLGAPAQSAAELAASAKYAEGFKRLLELHSNVKDVHPLLEDLHPVAVVEGEAFYVFDVIEEGRPYELARTAKPSMIVPEGVRAAFPLDFYDNKMSCVVTGEVFDDLSGYATIFHEFIHCAQMATCELELKARLSIAQQAEAADDFMWELSHPFPYADGTFEEIYTLFLERAAAGDSAAVSRCREFLREVLNAQDYEYMVWQEWKEGFARFIENKVRAKLELELSVSQAMPPFNRVTFYEGGARYISLLVSEDAELEKDIEALFQRIAGSMLSESHEPAQSDTLAVCSDGNPLCHPSV
jgi:hypothetical protein